MSSETTAPVRTGAVPRYARIDVIGGAVMVFLAGLIWYGAIGLRLGTMTDFGPGAMPKGLAVILFVSGAAVLLHGLLQHGSDEDTITLALRPPLILALAIAIFGLFVRGGDFWLFSTPRLGLLVVGPLAVIISGFATPQGNLKELLVLALGLTAVSLLVFPDLLGVPIPVFPEVIEKSIPPSFGVEAAVRVAYVIYGVLTAILYVVFFKLPEMRRG